MLRSCCSGVIFLPFWYRFHRNRSVFIKKFMEFCWRMMLFSYIMDSVIEARASSVIGRTLSCTGVHRWKGILPKRHAPPEGMIAGITQKMRYTVVNHTSICHAWSVEIATSLTAGQLLAMTIDSVTECYSFSLFSEPWVLPRLLYCWANLLDILSK